MKKQIEFLKSLIVSYKADLTILDELLLQGDIQSCEVLIKKRKAQIEIVESVIEHIRENDDILIIEEKEINHLGF